MYIAISHQLHEYGTLGNLQLQTVIAIICVYYMMPDSQFKPDLTKIVTIGNVSC